jgi:7-carboxy-7-deazaguanine synthase
MTKPHLINSIYRATEGEGIFLGRPQIFIRYQGCAVGCLNCDSKETWDFNQKMGKTLEEVLSEVKSEGLDGLIKNVSITGGDPLHPSHTPRVLSLAKALKEKHYYINIEAAGTRVVDEVFALVDYISFDFKTPSTGVKTPIANVLKMFQSYSGKFQIKAVVSDHCDFKSVLAAHEEIAQLMPLTYSMNPWVLTPCFNNTEEFPTERFIQVLRWNEEAGGPFRVIGQQHKWIFGPDKKLV